MLAEGRCPSPSFMKMPFRIRPSVIHPKRSPRRNWKNENLAVKLCNGCFPHPGLQAHVLLFSKEAHLDGLGLTMSPSPRRISTMASCGSVCGAAGAETMSCRSLSQSQALIPTRLQDLYSLDEAQSGKLSSTFRFTFPSPLFLRLRGSDGAVAEYWSYLQGKGYCFQL